VNKFCC